MTIGTEAQIDPGVARQLLHGDRLPVVGEERELIDRALLLYMWVVGGWYGHSV
jgi:hypothetical protein